MNATLDPGRDTIRLPYQEAEMVRKAQVLIHAAIDLWLGELARQGKAPATRDKYRRVLDPFGDAVRHKAPGEIRIDDVRLYLDRWVDAAPATMALYVTVLRRFFAFLEDEGIVHRSPADRIKRPRRPRPEDTDVITLTPAEATAVMGACDDWQEILCIALLLYMGVRRKAAANARRRDCDLEAGMLRFVEKGGKPITKPIPDEFLALLRHARDLGQWTTGDDWLVPNRKPWLVKSKQQRGDKIIYETVKRVAARVDLEATVHAFRGAFAVAYDDAHPDHNHTLQNLLGHVRPETTQVYLRRRNKAKAMENVRDLSFGLPARFAVPPAGFEPALPPNADGVRDSAVDDAETLAFTLLNQASGEAGSVEPKDRVDAAEVDV